ncbi:peptidoglycan-binding protein [Pseudomonas putida]|uniref:peptidoglycan-binding domain-containing protein n=1 Tax=Pseudomonas putida TaxID=303 RepID=UPI00383AD4E2
MSRSQQASAATVRTTALALLACLVAPLILRAAVEPDDLPCHGESTCSASSVSAPLSSGSARSLIRRVQLSLGQHHYYTGPVDGELGQWTQRALFSFQHSMHLSETGSINSSTLQRLAIPVPPWMAASMTPAQDVP